MLRLSFVGRRCRRRARFVVPRGRPAGRQDPAARGRRRHFRDRRAPARRGRAGSADSGLRRRRRAHHGSRRVQRQPHQGADSLRPALFIESAQHGRQHPRPRLAVRPHERRHRARRRLLRRRRVVRAAGGDDARLHRRRARRGAARAAGHAVRQEHDGGRDPRDDAQGELHSGIRLRARLRRRRVRPSEGLLSGPLGEKVAGRMSFSSTQRDGMLYNVATQEKVNDLDNIGVRDAASRDAERAHGRHVRARLHEPGAEGLRAGVRGRRADAALGVPAVRDDHRRPRLRAAEPRPVRPPHRSQHAVEVRQRNGRRLGQRRRRGRPRHADVDDVVALLELGSVERPRLPRVARRHAVAGAVDARAGDARDSLGGRPLRHA